MAKAVRYKDGTLMMPGSEAFELYHNPPKSGQKVPNAPKTLDQHMAELDKAWRKAEGRKPVAQLTEREKMLEGRIPWNPALLNIQPKRVHPRSEDGFISEGSTSPAQGRLDE